MVLSFRAFSMVLSSTTKVIKLTANYVRNVMTKAFSSKYLLITNLTISAAMAGSADGIVQKTCRHYGMNKRTSVLERFVICKWLLRSSSEMTR